MTTEKSKEAQVQEAVRPEFQHTSLREIAENAPKPKRSILQERLINTKDSKETFLRALLYGVSGSGKTHTARTLPLDRTLVLLVEPKHLPLRGQDIDAITIHSWAEYAAAFREIAGALKNGVLEVNGKKKNIIFIDSLSHINELCKQQIIKKDRPALLYKAEKDVGNIYDELLGINDWQLLGARIDATTSAFCHLPIDLIFTCLERWITDEETGINQKAPLLNGNLPITIGRYFDCVFHQKMSDIDGQIIAEFETHQTPTMGAKSQVEINATEPADWTAILQKLFGKRGK